MAAGRRLPARAARAPAIRLKKGGFKEKIKERRRLLATSRPAFCQPFHHHGSTRFARWLVDSHVGGPLVRRLPCVHGDHFEPFLVVPVCATNGERPSVADAGRPARAGGLGAGLFSVLATAPFDVVKTRMQSKDAKNYASTPDCFRQIATREGPRAFFNGALARAARVVPGQGIIFVCVDLVYDAIARASSAS